MSTSGTWRRRFGSWMTSMAGRFESAVHDPYHFQSRRCSVCDECYYSYGGVSHGPGR